MFRFFTISLALLLCASTAFADGTPITRAEGLRLSKATGHWSRSRQLLLAAIREFDKGAQLVNPDALLDSSEWRSRMLDRAVDLQRVLDPQPRASEAGVRFESDNSLIGEAK